MVGVVVNVFVKVGVNIDVKVGPGVEVCVFVEVGDDLMIPPPAVAVVPTIKRDVGVKDGVGDAVPDIAAMEVIVTVGVKLATRVSPPLTGMIREEVGVKKRSAKASCVNARSRGVVVAVCLGRRMISSCVSSLPPAIRTGRLNARIHAPIITNRTMTPCAFTGLDLLFFSCCESSIIARSSMIRLNLPPLIVHL